MRLAASRTFCTAGRSKPIRTAMMAITTNSSISVKPDRREDGVIGIPPKMRPGPQGRPGTGLREEHPPDETLLPLPFSPVRVCLGENRFRPDAGSSAGQPYGRAPTAGQARVTRPGRLLG